MQVTTAALEAIYYEYNLRFQGGYSSAAIWWNKLCMLMPSTTRSERYAWMKKIPAFREWVGERQFNNVVGRSYEIFNKDWENSIEIDRNDIQDDRIGLFSPFMEMMGLQAARWPDHTMAPIIQAGSTTGLAFDGHPFFDDDHPIDMDKPALGTYQNLFINAPLSPDTVSAVRATMASYLGEDGKPMEVNPQLLIVPPQLRDRAAQICSAEWFSPAAAFGTISAGAPSQNVLKGMFDFVEVPQFANEPNVFYLADMSKPVKPFVWQLREPVKFVSVVDPASVPVFNSKKFQFGADSRGNGGYSLPFLCARCEG